MRISIAVHNFSLGHALWPYPVNQYSSSVRVSTGKEGGLPFFKTRELKFLMRKEERENKRT